MSVRRTGDLIELIGGCAAEDAETLLAHLLDPTDENEVRIDVSACDSAHGAVVQLLRLLPARVFIGVPRGAFLRQHVWPALTRESSSAGAA